MTLSAYPPDTCCHCEERSDEAIPIGLSIAGGRLLRFARNDMHLLSLLLLALEISESSTYPNFTSRPVSEARLIASTRRCHSTAVAKSGCPVFSPRIALTRIDLANSEYICPTWPACPAGVSYDANVKR